MHSSLTVIQFKCPVYFQTSSNSLVSSPKEYWVKFVKLYAIYSPAVLMFVYKCSPQHFDLWHLRFARGPMFRMSICGLWRRVLRLFFYYAVPISDCVTWVSLNWTRYRGRLSRPGWYPGIVLDVLRETKNHRSCTGRDSNHTSVEYRGGALPQRQAVLFIGFYQHFGDAANIS